MSALNYAGFPRHDEDQYHVQEHDETSAPTDLLEWVRLCARTRELLEQL